MKLLPLLLAILFILAGPVAANSVQFDTMSYQGVLTDQNGIIVPDDTYAMTFTIYRASDGTALWTETQNVPVADGHFDVALGAIVPLSSLAFDEAYQLGIQVGADPEMTPRTALRSVPYSHAARSLAMDETTRYLTVCAEAFTPGSSNTLYSKNTLRVYAIGGGSASFGVALNLPHGARLLALHALFEDVDPLRDVALLLRRTNVHTGAFGAIASVTSGIANAAGLTPVETLAFSDDIVDNENWAHSLQLYYGDSAGSNLTLMAVRVTYAVSEPLP